MAFPGANVKVNCNICSKSVNSSAVSNFNDAFSNDSSIAEALAQFAGIEITPYPELSQACFCLEDCYPRLRTGIAFQEMVRQMFNHLIATAHDTIDPETEMKIEWIDDSIKSPEEHAMRRTQLGHPEGKVHIERESIVTTGRPFTTPSNPSYIKTCMKFDNIEYLLLNGEMCCSCDFVGATGNELMEHINATHGREDVSPIEPFVCDLCYETFGDGDRLRRHRQWFKNSEIFLCKVCSYGFLTKDELAQHIRGCVEWKSLEEDMKKTPIDEYLVEEPKRESNDNYTMPQADMHVADEKQNMTKIRLKKSIRHKTTAPNGYGCCFLRCSSTFDEEHDLNDHVQEKHAARKRIHRSERTSNQHVCGTCELSFRSEKTLHQHRNGWRLKQQNVCRHCGRGFVRGRDLSIHERMEHSDTLLPQQFMCEVCGKCFKKKSLVRLHLITHQQDRRYGCEECGGRFHFRYQLRKHQQSVHAKDYPYECSYCDRKMADKNRYDLHVRQHTGEKPYGCRQGCDQTFADSTDRRRHEMVKHTGEKPHRCGGCSVAYTRRRHLLLHFRKHPAHAEIDLAKVREGE